LFSREEGADGAGDPADDEPPVYSGPLAVLFALFELRELFEPGVRALYLTLGAEEARGVPSVSDIVRLLAPLGVASLRRLAAMVALPVPDTRLTASVRADSVSAPLSGKLSAIFAAYVEFAESRPDHEDGGWGGGRRREKQVALCGSPSTVADPDRQLAEHSEGAPT
jgi:hypothetical protein